MEIKALYKKVFKNNKNSEKEKVDFLNSYMLSEENDIQRYAVSRVGEYNEEIIKWAQNMKSQDNELPTDELVSSDINNLCYQILLYKKTGSISSYRQILRLLRKRKEKESMCEDLSITPILCALFFSMMFIVSIFNLLGGTISGS
ncbi:MAG: hypothetical protein HUJ61_02830 [Bacilli bacterium]|nr:hypothetical protein [Bacilli bacterium]